MQQLCHTALILAISFIICLIVTSSGAAPYYPSEGPVDYCSGSAGLHQTEHHHLADPAQGCTKHQGHPATKPHLATITRSSRINRIGSWSDRPPPQEIIRSKPLDYKTQIIDQNAHFKDGLSHRAQWDSWGIKESRAMFICLEHPKWLNNVNVTDRGDKHRTAQLFVFYILVHIIVILSLKRKYQFPRVTALMMLWLMAWFDPTRPRNPTFSHTISQVVKLSTPEFYLLGEGVKNVFSIFGIRPWKFSSSTISW